MCKQDLKQKQDEKISDLKAYIKKLEEELILLHWQVKELRILQEKPWKRRIQ
jgi:hypothetical protein